MISLMFRGNHLIFLLSFLKHSISWAATQLMLVAAYFYNSVHCQEITHKVWRIMFTKCDWRIIETLKKNLGFEERAFYCLNSKFCRTEPKISFFHSACRDATKTITFHNGLMPARAEKLKRFLAEKSNKCDWRITESLKKDLVYEGRAFYRLNQRILPKITGDIVFSVLAVMLQRE